MELDPGIHIVIHIVADGTMRYWSGSSSDESSVVEAGLTRVVDEAAKVEGAEEAACSVVTLVDSVTGAREAASEGMTAESVEVG
jgi:hypothetical protein